MKLLQLKFLTLFLILLFIHEISLDQSNHGITESIEITPSQCSVNESQERNCLNLELKESKSRPTIQGEKVEPLVITNPFTNYSKVRLLDLFTLQKIAFSRKSFTLISHFCLLISKTLQISPLVNVFRI